MTSRAVFKLRFWHRWLALMTLLPLLVVAISGSLLVYKKPLIRFFVTNNATLPTGYSPSYIYPQLNDIETALANGPPARIKAPNQDEPYWSITQGKGAPRLLHVITLTPYTSNLWVLQSITFLHHLHTKLMLGKIGESILLASALACLFFVISGVYLWWPGRKGFRWRFIKPWPFKAHMLLQFHRHTGVVIAPVLLVISLTASLMLWQKQVAPLLAPLPTSVKPYSLPLTQAQPIKAGEALALALAYLPDAELTYVRLPSEESAVYRFRFRLKDEWHPNGRTSINVNVNTHQLELSPRSDSVPWPYRIINQNYPLHSGYGFQGLYPLAIFLAGIGLVWLSITGLMSYLRQAKRSAPKHQKTTKNTNKKPQKRANTG